MTLMTSIPSGLVSTGAVTGRSNFYIYGLYAKNRLQELFYIGKGCNKRMYRHFTEEPPKTHKKRILNKYSCYPMFIAGGLSEKFAYALEERLVDLYSNPANKMRGGLGGKSGRVLSRPTREKIRAANTGKTPTAETKAKISKSNKEYYTLNPPQKGSGHFNYGRKHCLSEQDSRLGPKLDLNFIAYHMWAYEISGLSLFEYVKNKPFTFGAFSDWRSKRFSYLANPIVIKIAKKPRKQMYSPNFIKVAIKLFLKSGLTQLAFASQLGIPRGTLNGFLIKARDLRHSL